MTAPADVNEILAGLFRGVSACFGDGLVGFYLRGSLALDAFDPETSDIDFLAVTRRPVSEAEFGRLQALHRELAASPNRYARHLEGSYIDAPALRRFGPRERLHPSVGVDWELQWLEHRDNWVIERWLLRKHAMTVHGPVPGTLIDVISVEELQEAVRNELQRRVEEWAEGPAPPRWLLPRNYQAFEIETMCRALQTLATGETGSKAAAVKWALERGLPEPWQAMVRASQAYRGETTEHPEGAADVQAFVRWAEAEGEDWAASSRSADIGP